MHTIIPHMIDCVTNEVGPHDLKLLAERLPCRTPFRFSTLIAAEPSSLFEKAMHDDKPITIQGAAPRARTPSETRAPTVRAVPR